MVEQLYGRSFEVLDVLKSKKIKHGKICGSCSRIADGCVPDRRLGRKSLEVTSENFYHHLNGLLFQEVWEKGLSLSPLTRPWRYWEQSTGQTERLAGKVYSRSSPGCSKLLKSTPTRRTLTWPSTLGRCSHS